MDKFTLNPCCLSCLLYKENGHGSCSGVEEWSAETTGHMFCHTKMLKTESENKIFLVQRKLNNAIIKSKIHKQEIKFLTIKLSKLKKNKKIHGGK